MKKLLILLLFLGCAKTHCPNDDMVIISPYTNMPIQISEGTFDDPDKCVTTDEFEAAMNEYRQKMIDQYMDEKPKSDM